MKIGFIDSVHPALWKGLTSEGHECIDLTGISKEEIISSIGEYNGLIIRSRFKLTKEILDKCSDLKFIARAGAGMENIDVEYAESKGIRCLHAPEGNRDAVGEHALGTLLNLFNNINRADREVRDGKWIREGNRGIELSGKTVGIIGYGNMGSAFAKRLKGFDVRVLAYDKYKGDFLDEFMTQSSLETIFKEADVLSLHIPLTEETKFMVDKAFLNSFEKPIYLINTARGKVVKTVDLVEALKNGKVKGVCLDVLEVEDISFEKLAIDDIKDEELRSAFNYLISSDKVVLTPHIGGWTHESNEKISLVLLRKIVELDTLS